MHPVRVRIQVDLGIGDDAEFTTSPMIQRYADIPAEVALTHLDRAYADAKAWIESRRSNPAAEADPK